MSRLESQDGSGQSEGVDGEPGDRLVGTGVRLVVEDVDRAVPHLQKVDVTGDHAWAAGFGRELDAMLALKRCEVILAEPDRDLDRDCHAIVGQHEPLRRLVPQFVVADSGDHRWLQYQRRA